MKQPEFVMVSFDLFHERERRREGSVYSDQRTGVIDAKPAVKIQSASSSPGIAIAPRSVVQVPMSDDGSTDSGGVVATLSMLSGVLEVNEGEDEESGDGDDEEEVDEINHARLLSVVVHPHSPGRREHTSAVWTHLRRIDKHDVPGHEMNAECTHVCVCHLSDGEEGVKRYCNTPLKLFRSTKTSDALWSTTAAVTHSKKIHED